TVEEPSPRARRRPLLDQLPPPHLRLDVHPAQRRSPEPPPPGGRPRRPPAAPPLHPARGDDRPGLRRAAVHDPAALRLPGEARPPAPGGRGRSGGGPGRRLPAGHPAAHPPRHGRRGGLGLHPQPRAVRGLGPPGRGEERPRRQPRAEPVRRGAQPAVRGCPRLRADRSRPPPPPRLRPLRPEERGRGGPPVPAAQTGRAGRALLGPHPLLVYLFLYGPIVVLAVFSFNAGRQTALWEGFTLDWYRKLLADDRLLAAAGTSLLVAAV